jgi:SAM-dependent methyltransferase
VNEVFGGAYADAYDAFYAEKDYGGECDLLEDAFRRYGRGRTARILDLGCGTGTHAICLAARGYEVVGVDRSAGMVAQARRKAASLSPRPSFYRGDIGDVEIEGVFDAALLMFAVLGYQTEDASVEAALRTAARHVRPDGLLLFDVWYGPAVARQRPGRRAGVFPVEGGRIERTAAGTLGRGGRICTVRIGVKRYRGERVVQETHETHRMRCFYPDELDAFLARTGFASVRRGAFPDLARGPDETTWNVFQVARRVPGPPRGRG